MEERRADLGRQLAKARKDLTNAELTIKAIDGAMQENSYYVLLLAEREHRNTNAE